MWQFVRVSRGAYHPHLGDAAFQRYLGIASVLRGRLSPWSRSRFRTRVPAPRGPQRGLGRLYNLIMSQELFLQSLWEEQRQRIQIVKMIGFQVLDVFTPLRGKTGHVVQLPWAVCPLGT